MALIKKINSIEPKFGENCYLAETATIIGDVVIGKNCSIWFNAVIRGDVNSIQIGDKVNIQDNSTLHCLYKKSKIFIGNNVTVGHNVVIHGATIKDNVLVGIGSIILDHAIIGENTIIAAGSVVLENQKIEANSIYAGTPAKRIKEIDSNQTEEMIERIANNYLMYASWYK